MAHAGAPLGRRFACNASRVCTLARRASAAATRLCCWPQQPCLAAATLRLGARGPEQRAYRRRHPLACTADAAGRDYDHAEATLDAALAGPRMEAGLDVHRRVHAIACKHGAYLFQWRAFCERQRRSWQDVCTTEDEAVLAAFQYECERGIVQFEADVAAGRAQEYWPPRCFHPTQGMAALAATLRAASEATLGRARVFRQHG